MSGGFFGDLGAWAGTQNWLPGFLGGPGDAGLAPGQMGPMPGADLSMYGPVDPSGMGQQMAPAAKKPGNDWAMYQRALQQAASMTRQQPQHSQGEYFGSRRIR